TILNFGHTFGHAIETATGYKALKHGEAIGIGMCMASALSLRLGLCEESVPARIKGLISAVGLQPSPPAISPPRFMEAIRLDKKVLGQRLRFVLPVEVGRVILRDVPEPELVDFIKEFKG
ncbi:MAG: 3-dehydroquinate synthase, partial [Deltaproteobacteria bacterium]|nr:3-dehydroquinate synthase [Deltaproteobacteria bacterium]